MINLFSVNVHKDVDAAIADTLHSGYITQGPKVDMFEHEFARFVGMGADNAVAVNSGTSALTLALRVAGVGPGDEVISTPMTCTATNLPILSLGATIKWADVDPDTGMMLVDNIKSIITWRTRAIMVCDWGGTPNDLNYLKHIAHKGGIPLIEDAAHALGATYEGQPVGSIADFTCFSFQAIKHLTTVDGGMLMCQDPAAAKEARTLRWFGIDRTATGRDSRIDQDIEEWGYKFHMNDVTAAMGLVQLTHVKKVIQRHQIIARLYDEYLHPGFEKPLRGNYESSYWLYTILLPAQLRNEFKEYMLANDVQVSQVHKRNDDYTVFAEASYHLDAVTRNSYPGLDGFSSRMICIPINYGMTNKDVSRVISLANKWAKEFLQ